MDTELTQWSNQLQTILMDFAKQTSCKPGQLFVIGCSTSEVIGEKIGTAGTEEVAQMIYMRLAEFRASTGVSLAFQCCEHLNRAIVMERKTAELRGYEEVSVIPVRSAGGAMATFAYGQMEEPVVVESIAAEAGMDIGDTLIGMHLKQVAVPIRASLKNVGSAHVTLAKTRPKLIGGARAIYEQSVPNESCK